jgi:hypothetical protein
MLLEVRRIRLHWVAADLGGFADGRQYPRVVAGSGTREG